MLRTRRRGARTIRARSSVSSRGSSLGGRLGPGEVCAARVAWTTAAAFVRRLGSKMLEFSEWAVDILRRSNEAARRFNPDARVRLSRQGSGVRFALTDRPEPGDRELDEHGFVLFVEEG